MCVCVCDMAPQTEEACTASTQQLQDDTSKGADKLKAQLAGKDAPTAERHKNIATLQKAGKDGQKEASTHTHTHTHTHTTHTEQLASLKKALADQEKAMTAALADKDKELTQLKQELAEARARESAFEESKSAMEEEAYRAKSRLYEELARKKSNRYKYTK